MEESMPIEFLHIWSMYKCEFYPQDMDGYPMRLVTKWHIPVFASFLDKNHQSKGILHAHHPFIKHL